MSMENIDLRNIACFGFTMPRKESWRTLLKKVSSNGWKSVDDRLLEKSLVENVKSSYVSMVSMSFKDLDTDVDYIASFDNNLKQWKLEIPDSPPDALDPNDMNAFFKSEQFKKVCVKAD